MNRKCLIGLAVLLALIGSTTSAFADWEVVKLHPTVHITSRALGVSGGQQVGWAYVGDYPNGSFHASLWNGTAASFTDLNPAGSYESYARCAYGGQQGGYAFVNNCTRAVLWSGSASSWVDLHPGGDASDVFGMSEGQQVGYRSLSISGGALAALWSGTKASFVNLNPGTLGNSIAYAVSDGQQVGWVKDLHLTQMIKHASLWSGTAESWVDIHPVGYRESSASGVSHGQQVGYAKIDGSNHAGLWRGSTASFVDLNPIGSSASEAQGVSHGLQVGHATIGYVDRASLWSGSASSWVDLHSVLGSAYSKSYASAIEVSGNDVWVAGYAFVTATGRVEAVMWHNVIPEPSSLLALGSGLIVLGGLILRRGG